MKRRPASTMGFGVALVLAVFSFWATACETSDDDAVVVDEVSAADGTDLNVDTDEVSEAIEPTPEAILPGTTLRLITHDSFSVSDGLFDNFTLETGIDVDVVKAGDAGELVSRAILTAGQPEADVMYGVDNTFLQRALDAEIFIPYTSPALSRVPD